MRLLAVAALLALSGCAAAADITGVLVGAAAGGASANPAVGFGVGVATAAATDYAFKRIGRSWHQGEQDAIATAAAPLPPGTTAPWRIRHSVPLGNEHGTLQVIRAIDNPLAACKQILFSVEEKGEPTAWYSADLCRQGAGWKWASAEPAVERWGTLQ